MLGKGNEKEHDGLMVPLKVVTALNIQFLFEPITISEASEGMDRQGGCSTHECSAGSLLILVVSVWP